jgi:hypothetical protein
MTRNNRVRLLGPELSLEAIERNCPIGLSTGHPIRARRIILLWHILLYNVLPLIEEGRTFATIPRSHRLTGGPCCDVGLV